MRYARGRFLGQGGDRIIKEYDERKDSKDEGKTKNKCKTLWNRMIVSKLTFVSGTRTGLGLE